MRHVDERSGGAVRLAQGPDVCGDVDDLGPPLGLTENSRTAAYPTPPCQTSLDEYRDEADRFLAELEEEYYLHFAGLKDRLELAAIYERHAELASLDACRWLGGEAEGARPGSSQVELWRFACEGFLGNLARERGGAHRRAGGDARGGCRAVSESRSG